MLLPDFIFINASASADLHTPQPPQSAQRAAEPPLPGLAPILDVDRHDESFTYEHTLNFSLSASGRRGGSGKESSSRVAATVFANLRMLPQVAEWRPSQFASPRLQSPAREKVSVTLPQRSNPNDVVVSARLDSRRSWTWRKPSISAPRSPIPSLSGVSYPKPPRTMQTGAPRRLR